jgi:flavin-dependent dehydrogenase
MEEVALKSKIDTIVENLPPDGQEELSNFLDLLAEKYLKRERKAVALGGIWARTPLDVSDNDIRELREEVSKQLLKKFDNELSG